MGLLCSYIYNYTCTHTYIYIYYSSVCIYIYIMWFACLYLCIWVDVLRPIKGTSINQTFFRGDGVSVLPEILSPGNTCCWSHFLCLVLLLFVYVIPRYPYKHNIISLFPIVIVFKSVQCSSRFSSCKAMGFPLPPPRKRAINLKIPIISNIKYINIRWHTTKYH